jgi:hypothetical protein
MTLVFSHPAATGFVNGGFWEKCHPDPQGAYFRGDWSMNPNGTIWEELVTRKWRTEESGKTDGNGVWATRGFQGEYEIAVRAGDKSSTQRILLGLGGTQLIIPFK